MAQDPQGTGTTIVVPETSESWNIFSEQTSGTLSAKIYTGEGYSINARQLGPGASSVPDCRYVLWSAVTYDHDGADLGIVPVLALDKGAKTGSTSSAIPASFVQGVVEISGNYDPNSSVFHLWYFVNAWTSCTIPNNYGEGGSASALAVIEFDPEDVNTFDANNFFVIPQRNLSSSEMSKAARVLLHAVARERILDGNQVYLVIENEPEVVSTWALKEAPVECQSCVKVVCVLSEEPNEKGYYDAVIQEYDVKCRRWITKERVWVVDAQAAATPSFCDQ